MLSLNLMKQEYSFLYILREALIKGTLPANLAQFTQTMAKGQQAHKSRETTQWLKYDVYNHSND